MNYLLPLDKGFNPDQPRVPAGSSEGGQFGSGGGRAPLPMDTNSRLARAREQGFDTSTKWFHGTSATFSAFKTPPGDLNDGVFISTNPSKASAYAGGDTPSMYPKDGDAPQVHALYIRGKVASYKQYEAAYKQAGGDWKKARELLASKGYVGQAGLGGNARVWDPKNIRSVNAMFDPKHKDSAELSKGKAATTIQNERTNPLLPLDKMTENQPRTLYVKRRLLNAGAVRAWAASQGIASALPAGDMHATVAFSREPVDWSQFESEQDNLVVMDDGVEKAFDPNQPRDERGQWTSGGGGEITAWHGTAEQVSQRILREGIKVQPKDQQNFQPGLYESGRGGSVFITNDREAAAMYAESAANNFEGGRPALIELRVPKGEWRTFKADLAHRKELMVEGTEGAYRSKTIPPTWIVRITSFDNRWEKEKEIYRKQQRGSEVVVFLVVVVDVDISKRAVHQFPARTTPNGALVLRFEDPHLRARWQEFLDGGASWDFPEYQPHITITYAVAAADVAAIEPYRGPLIFGPEEFAEVDDGWAGEIVEEPTDIAKGFNPDQPRVPAGSSAGGQFGSGVGGGAAGAGGRSREEFLGGREFIRTEDTSSADGRYRLTYVVRPRSGSRWQVRGRSARAGVDRLISSHADPVDAASAHDRVMGRGLKKINTEPTGELAKYNPNHDERGRFAEGSSGGGGGSEGGGSPDKAAKDALTTWTKGAGLGGASLSEQQRGAIAAWADKQPKAPHETYRGDWVSSAELARGKFAVGSEVKFDGVTSFTADPIRTGAYGRGGDFHVQFVLPVGEAVNISRWSVYPQEQEHILARPARYRIVSRSKPNPGMFRLKLARIVEKRSVPRTHSRRAV